MTPSSLASEFRSRRSPPRANMVAHGAGGVPHSQVATSRPRGAWMRIKRRLIALTLCALLPMVAFAVAMVTLRARHERATQGQGFLEMVRALRLALDRELASAVAALHTLAASSALRRDDLREFYAEAQRVLAQNDQWVNMSLVDPGGAAVIGARVAQDYAR